MTEPALDCARRLPLAVFFALAYGISWLIWAPLWLPAFGVSALPVLPLHHALGAVGPIAAAFALVAWERGLGGVRELLARMVAWRDRLPWLCLVVVGPLVVLGIAIAAAFVLTEARPTLSGIGRSREFPSFSVLSFVVYNVFSFGFGEEVGWRGYALPRLQARHSALGARLRLTLGWAVWHLPLFFYRPGYVGMGVGGIAGWLVSLLTGAVLLTWLYNASRGSLLVVALFHAMIDVIFTSDVSSPFVVNATGALVTCWGLLVLVISGPRDLGRRTEEARNGPEAA